jgi:hypothetical protein
MPSTINAKVGNATSATALIKTGAADANLVLQANSANALTISQFQNVTCNGTGGIRIPSGTVAQRPSPATVGMLRNNTDYACLEVYVASSWANVTTPKPFINVAPVISGTASVGQNLTSTTGTWYNTPDSYTYQWLANSSAISSATSNVFTLTTTQAGANITCNVTAINASGNGTATSNSLGPVTSTYSISYLLVGGGGGGSSGGNYGGGGGAGQHNSTTGNLAIGVTYTVTVGGGGGSNSNGSNTTISGGGTTYTGIGGGNGSGINGGLSGNGYTGGSGGNDAPYYAGGGGAGSSANGQNAQGNNNGPGGNGGAGTASSITGSSVTRAGGGGGGCNGGNGGSGAAGGGTGSNGYLSGNYNGGSASANTGSGGGGAVNATGGTGGSGVAVLVIPTAKYTGVYTGSPTISTSGSDTIMLFNASGSYTA